MYNNQIDNNVNQNSDITTNENAEKSMNNTVNVKPIMYKNENDMSQIMIKRILYFIILVLIVVIVILIMKKRPVVSNAKEEELKQNIKEYTESIKTLGIEKYYQALNLYGDIVLNTKLICGNMDKSTLIDNYYMKSENVKFQKYQNLSNYVRNIFYGDIIEKLLTTNRFKNYNGNLYCVDETRSSNAKYKGLKEVTIDNITSNKIDYILKEEYLEEENCKEECSTTIKENKFTIEYKNDRWYVTVFTLPYL